MPWVRLAEQNPPLRPEAAQPTVFASSEHDVELRVPLAGEQRGPQAGEPAADDRQVGGDVARQGGERLGRVGLVEPERARHRAGQGPGDGRVARCRLK